VLQVDGVRLNRYRTLYFDTADLEFYTSHHTGRTDRFKVRSRSYLDSGVSFLEVKHKSKKGRVTKDRIRTESLLTQLTPELGEFVDELTPLQGRPLQPTLWNEFSRITLVSKGHQERVTFDLDLCFLANHSISPLAQVVIAELKQESLNRSSALVAQMRALGLRPTGFSKYCIGTALLYPEVKHNRFKPVLRVVQKAMRGDQNG
jgi:hypothetical protein